ASRSLVSAARSASVNGAGAKRAPLHSAAIAATSRPRSRCSIPISSARGLASPISHADDDLRRNASYTRPAIAARSDEPPKRCARPQSLSASAAGRRRASRSAMTSIAAERRAAGVMRVSRLRPPSFHGALDRRGAADSRRVMTANVLADLMGGIAQLRAAESFGDLALVNRSQHAPQQIIVVLIAIRLGVEIVGYLSQALIAYSLDVFLHEAVVVVPVDAGGAHRRLLRARRDLMGVEIMQPELNDQRLLHLLVQDEVAVGLDRAAAELEGSRHVAVDVDGLAVLAVAREVGNVVLAVELFHPPHDCVEGAVHHQVGDIPFRQLQLLMRRGWVAKVERHGVEPRSWGCQRKSYSTKSLRTDDSRLHHTMMPVSTSTIYNAHMIMRAKAPIEKNRLRSRTTLLVMCT